MTTRRLTRAALLGLLAALAVPGTASAGASPQPLGLTCTPENGVRFCPAQTLDQRVRSFDGVPIDADVTLPPTGDGPFPTLAMLHGVGGSKRTFESTTINGNGPPSFHYNNLFYARRGYAVINYSARGWGNSCGVPASRTAGCERGWIRLADQRYDTRDLQGLFGRLVDEGIADPDNLGATGVSLGGGGTMGAAFLNDSIRLPDGSFRPWRSPAGRRLSLAAGWARWEWATLADALVPNGRFLDDDNATIGRFANPLGVGKLAFVTGLVTVSNADAYVAPQGADPAADINTWYSVINAGEPYGAELRAVEAEVNEFHSAMGIYERRPAPLLLNNGFTDDLFPATHGLMNYNAIRSRHPTVPVGLQLGDLGHGRAQNKQRVNATFNDAGARFLDSYLRDVGTPPANGRVTVLPQTCPSTVPDGAPITARSWAAIAPRTFYVARAAGPAPPPPPPPPPPPFTGGATQRAQTILSTQTGDPLAADLLAIPENFNQTCRPFAARTYPGTAVYQRNVARALTMVGLPTVTATVRTTGPFGQINARLWDVSPNGTQTLIARSVYRLTPNKRGRIRFQLWGNAFRFAAGHKVKLELLGRDAATPTPVDEFMRPSNGTFSVRFSNVTVALPTR